MFRCFVLAFAFAVVTLSIPVIAQTPTAIVTGQVQDASGAAVPGAKIQIRNVGTNQSRSGTSGAMGGFTVPNLPPGIYEVIVEADGFRRLHETGIELQLDQTARLRLQLEIGAVTESIEVTASVPLLNTENASKGDVIVSQEIAEMPLDGRDFTDLAYLVPGVERAAQGSQAGSGMSINGARADNTNFLIDGFHNQDPNQAGAIASPPLDSLQEFKMQTSGFSAEYGRLAGGVMNMALKSGTNQPANTIPSVRWRLRRVRIVCGRSTSRRLRWFQWWSSMAEAGSWRCWNPTCLPHKASTL